MMAKCDRCHKDMSVEGLLHLEYAYTFRTIKGMNHISILTNDDRVSALIDVHAESPV